MVPKLLVFSEMVPRDSKVAICVPESMQFDTRGLRDAIQKHCPTAPDTRNVTFQFEFSTGPLDSYLERRESLEECMTTPLRREIRTAANCEIGVVVYTVKPKNILTIYKWSNSSFTRHEPVPILKGSACYLPPQ